MFARYLTTLLLLIIISVLGSCQKSTTDDSWHRISIDNKDIRVEVADTPKERKQGLSGRKNLAKDKGMLFVYKKPQKHSFWMKNMLFPLDFI